MRDLSDLPTLYVLPTRLDDTQRAQIIANLESKKCRVASSARDADIFLGDVLRPKRAALELKFLGLNTTDVTKSTTAPPSSGRLLKVVRLEWYKKVVTEGAEANIDDFTVYRGLYSSSSSTAAKPSSSPKMTSPQKRPASPTSPAEQQTQERARRESIMRRAAMGASNKSSVPGTRHLRQSQATRPSPPSSPSQKRPRLLLSRESTGSHDEAEAALANLPPPPLWVVEKQKYSCTRSTPASPPPENKAFLDALYKIRLNRTLISDEIGIRAYSTAIAAVSAFPYPFTHVSQVRALPGCDGKIAGLWHEFTHSDPPGRLAAIDETDTSYYHTLELFYNIWGAGAHTARAFYERGFRDLDDIVEHHWSHLTRVQQIGVKFYDEFAIKIPRLEALAVRDAVQTAARKLLPGAEAAIVGGFRRGKAEGGDVDLLVTHPRVSKSRDVEELLVPLVDKLEAEGLITHVLTIHTPSRFVASQTGEVFPKRSHHNFDGIPKVLCVWQQPWDEIDADGDSQMANDATTDTTYRAKKNPNPHRRVDILFPPPRCAGSTLTSWSGATTFERDLRRYVRDKSFWKFSSEGITDRATGNRIPIGDEKGEFIGLTAEEEQSGAIVDDDVSKRGRKADGEWVGWEVEERKLFKVLELEWREPTERCTG
ncbi:hypothetical protein Dda_1706 [Drechslerella dactyloides]|uniref:DNA polymerase n=1 Tax=Drechslerella dactyloides TaxID=74499 RepID=A0AAD6J6J5_DREDA|nr:hypothetical protein Dda_1706 [Drechslerella dactyloides]